MKKSQVIEYRRNFLVDSGTADIGEYIPMKAKQFTIDQVLDLMKRRQGERTQREFAEELGVSQQYLCDVYLRKREPGESILKGLGMTRRTVFESVA